MTISGVSRADRPVSPCHLRQIQISFSQVVQVDEKEDETDAIDVDGPTAYRRYTPPDVLGLGDPGGQAVDRTSIHTFVPQVNGRSHLQL